MPRCLRDIGERSRTGGPGLGLVKVVQTMEASLGPSSLPSGLSFLFRPWAAEFPSKPAGRRASSKIKIAERLPTARWGHSPLCSIDRVAEMAQRDLVDGKRADEYRPQ
jgi:hypothetical protein